MEKHGWSDLHQQLSVMAREGRWYEMGELINDEMLHEFAVVAPTDALASAVKARYEGLLDRVSYYFPFVPGETDKEKIWQGAAAEFIGR
jgi:hypothetical protein